LSCVGRERFRAICTDTEEGGEEEKRGRERGLLKTILGNQIVSYTVLPLAIKVKRRGALSLRPLS
jgi:hypothetical protein